MKVAVYTVLFGEYDKWHEPKIKHDEYDYFLFTDQPIESKFYTVVPVILPKDTDTQRQQRELKILNFNWDDYDYSIYHDANITQLGDIKFLIDSLVTSIGVMNHPLRNCIYEEYEACAAYGKDNPEVMHKQVQGYLNEGYPSDNGMVQTGILVRKHTEAVKHFCERWWREVENGSVRDQLSFNYIAHHLGMRYDIFSVNILDYPFYYFKHL